ncbi:MAG: DoxX family membrane protein [Polyangiaceae bacterium]|nr:DoxX family membrane protein [Polyangiaceae bacterium]
MTTTEAGRPSRVREVLRYLLAALVAMVGITHFASPEPFVKMMPSIFPAPLVWVYLSGAAEVGLGILLAWNATRRLAAFGMIALFCAVFPANINMAVNGIQLDPLNPIPTWALWARLPLQALLIAWAWYVRGERTARRDPKP